MGKTIMFVWQILLYRVVMGMKELQGRTQRQTTLIVERVVLINILPAARLVQTIRLPHVLVRKYSPMVETQLKDPVQKLVLVQGMISIPMDVAKILLVEIVQRTKRIMKM